MPIYSAVRIGNMALSHIGSKSRIEDLDENSAAAKEIKLWYDPSRVQALEAHDWKFGRARKPLSLDGQAPPSEWLFRYALPSNCVAARSIVNPLGMDADPIPFHQEPNDNEAMTILTNQQDAELRYTRDVTNTGLFTPFFVEMLSHLIAYHSAMGLTGKDKIMTNELNIYQSLVHSAPAYDANEEMDQPPRDAEWIRGRGASLGQVLPPRFR